MIVADFRKNIKWKWLLSTVRAKRFTLKPTTKRKPQTGQQHRSATLTTLWFTLTKQAFFPERRSAKRLTFFLLAPPPGIAECILIIRLPPLRCVCAIVASPSRSLCARFRPAWLIVADFATSVLSELCCFPLLNYSVFVAVADRLRVLFSNFVPISLLANSV